MTSALSVEIRHSGIWQMTSAVLSCGQVCLVVDPGYFPRELDELSALCQARGGAAMVAFTHGHWDHVMGWRHFPDAEILCSSGLFEAIATGTEIARKNLRDASEFDRRWYIDRGRGRGRGQGRGRGDQGDRAAEPAWPPLGRTRALKDDEVLRVGDVELLALHLPGHSVDGLGLLAQREGLLLVGDYLSPCEIPIVEDLPAYRATLRRLLGLLEGVERVLPGHGPPLSRSEARAIAEADLSYLDALSRCRDSQDLAAALSLPLPRAADVPGMQDHHRENCQAAGLRLPSL